MLLGENLGFAFGYDADGSPPQELRYIAKQFSPYHSKAGERGLESRLTGQEGSFPELGAQFGHKL